MNDDFSSATADPGSPAATTRARLRNKVASGGRVICVGAGCGLTARVAEGAGADLIGLYNSAPLRLAGQGSLAGLLATGNANQIVRNLAVEVSAVVGDIPLVAGLLAADRSRPWSMVFDELRRLGVVGIQNSPTAGLVTGFLRANLEETGAGYSAEVDLIRLANRAGFLTCAYAFTTEEVRAMVDSGVDLIVAHLGLTGGGELGARSTVSLDQAISHLEGLAAAADSQGTDAILCCHGGPIATATEFAEVVRRVPRVQGFFGASAFERLPMERAIGDAIRSFTELGVGA
jgi:predicted TIM-barrel enzyme